ncbi:J domain-containing protein [Hymenobacter sp. BT175]|uniref:J domain-containing protein n=1 Tax=Hymenobacter translucens TaxID=2886507 RepID=UPI001D0E78BC|nr:J domain-containing protein [Hymenobacter translucens]MCC2547252.1 J domain-containing protein [Hymenobacter translucens]
MKNYYQILGIPEQANAAVIRQAYRRLVLLTHPDRTPDPAAHARYLEVNEAYDTLSNSSRRFHYDARLAASRRPRPVAAPPPPDVPPPAAYPPPPRRAGPKPEPYAEHYRRLRPYGRAVGWLGLAVVLLLTIDGFWTRTFPDEPILALEYSRPHGRRSERYFTVHTPNAKFRVSNITVLEQYDRLRIRRSALLRQVRQIVVLSGRGAGQRVAYPNIYDSLWLLPLLLGASSLVTIRPTLPKEHVFNLAFVTIILLVIVAFSLTG